MARPLSRVMMTCCTTEELLEELKVKIFFIAEELPEAGALN